jgi:DNA invertase Pin-like site-specific DNA recombinase
MLHPEMARELISQRTRELESQARQRGLAHTVRAAARARRRGQAAGATFVPPVIPDYVEDIVAAKATDQHNHARAGRTAA